MTETLHNVEIIPVSAIIENAGRRSLNEEKVREIAESFKELGQLVPIMIRKGERNKFILIAGAHRLAAARQIGWTTIHVTIRNVDYDEAMLIEIDENLKRSELTVHERTVLVNKRIEIVERRQAEEREKNEAGRGRPGGVAEAARVMGKDEDHVRRLAALKAVTDEAWDHAKSFRPDYKLDDNVSFMTRVAKTKVDFPCPEGMDPDGDEYLTEHHNRVAQAQCEFIDAEVDRREQAKAERYMEKQAQERLAAEAKERGEEAEAPKPTKVEDTDDFKTAWALTEALRTNIASIEDVVKRKKIANAVAKHIKALGEAE